MKAYYYFQAAKILLLPAIYVHISSRQPLQGKACGALGGSSTGDSGQEQHHGT